MTNPPRHVKLKADDLVFVLSQNDPSQADYLDDFKFYQKKEKPKNP